LVEKKIINSSTNIMIFYVKFTEQGKQKKHCMLKHKA
jgi:hypothetical protein